MSEQRRKDGLKFLKERVHSQIGKGRLKFHSVVPVKYWAGHGYPDADLPVHFEESVDISMREKDFEQLLDILGYFQSHGWNDPYYNDMSDNLAFERKLRKKHPALEKAYSRYRILLDLVAEGKEIED
jgi:hypothetical protein